ncbi:RNA polymerase sigma factor [Fontisphaera persica]|uniref:RNA polymerase sigma factor n=1 Tax=Fontisphaera persica TaxID=2974023 RepID=UPI0024C06CBD|nr:RNA polymerase sigma factor [Fontisphaera persica]WCJ60254.1 RNA polymerase sigma factor [Fontisphaera persica]
MARLAMGEPLALNDLMDRHAAAVYGFLCRLLGDEQEAEDLAQETFVRVFESCQAYRSEQRFTPWLFTIAANLARSRRRSLARHPMESWDHQWDLENTTQGMGSGSAEQVDPAQQLLQEERREAVRMAVNRLPKELREVIVLCEWEDLSMAETASVLGTTIKAVESRLYRARKELRKRLRPWLEEGMAQSG